ncbi:MAG: serine/threonine protein kinase [Pyrinomonadaceae bacterium]|nr:serine/threonine protein kinase [Pyrinomonadaceae bacterium]
MTTHNDQNSDTVFDEKPRETDPSQALTEVAVPSDASVQQTIASSGLGVGVTINNRYVIEKELGRGGIGVVYLARDQQLLSKRVVVKVLLEESQQNEWVRRKFQQEIEALTRVEHPGIVGVLDAGALPDGKPFLVMQYVEGAPLRAAMRVEGMELERTAHLMQQIGRALSAAHDKGILHRDLKPENIMLQRLSDGEEQIKVIDFGIAKIKDSLVAPETVTAATVGTILYMAPEQLSAKPVSMASDVYALGIIAHEMLTGRRPFNPDSSFQLLEMQRTGVRVRPMDLRPSLSEEAERVIFKALAFNPKDRYQRAKDFGDDLAKALTADAGVIDSPVSGRLSDPTLPTMPAGSGVGTNPLASERTFPAGASRETASQAYSPQPGSAPPPPPKRGMNPLLLAAVGLVLLGLIGFGAWYAFKPNSASQQNPGGAAVTTPERELSFSLTVRKMRDGKPFQEPFETSGQEIFENGWQFWMNVMPTQAGYLYVINEGPQPRNGLPSYNVLYPLDGGSAQVAANQKVESPPRQSRGYFFDDEAGTEKMWMIWAVKPVPELENVKGVANPQDKGMVTNPEHVRALQGFFTKQRAASNAQAEKDKKRTIIRAKGDVLVNLVELEHH